MAGTDTRGQDTRSRKAVRNGVVRLADGLERDLRGCGTGADDATDQRYPVNGFEVRRRSRRRQPSGNRQLTSPANAGERGEPPRASPLPGTRSGKGVVSVPHVCQSCDELSPQHPRSPTAGSIRLDRQPIAVGAVCLALRTRSCRLFAAREAGFGPSRLCHNFA
jgi:hypothetical protein